MANNRAASDASPMFDLPEPERRETEPPQIVATPPRIGWRPVALVAGLVAAGLWSVWITKSVMGASSEPRLARVQIAALITEYVQAQARTATPPEQVTAETRAFMAAVQHDLDSRGRKGQVVLVGEAVLAGNVPDITADVHKAVYAQVRMPQTASAAAGGVMGAMRQAMAGSEGGQSNGLAH